MMTPCGSTFDAAQAVSVIVCLHEMMPPSRRTRSSGKVSFNFSGIHVSLPTSKPTVIANRIVLFSITNHVRAA